MGEGGRLGRGVCSSLPAVIRTARPAGNERGGLFPAVCCALAESTASRGDIAAGRRRARRRGRSGAGVATRDRGAVDDRRLIGRRAAPPTIAPAATQCAAAQRQHDRQDQHLLHDSNSHRNRIVPSQGSCPKELYTTIGDEQMQHRCFSATISCRTCHANRPHRLRAICQPYRRAVGRPRQRIAFDPRSAHFRHGLCRNRGQQRSIGKSSLSLG